mgnify:CR=1 FL=1
MSDITLFYDHDCICRWKWKRRWRRRKFESGNRSYNWPGSSYQGVRVTVVDATSGAIICNPVDFTNKNIASIAGRIIHFGKVSKIQYRNGASLTPQSSGYVYYAPTNAMPPVVSSNSNPASIAAIKRYFCSEGAASMVANRTGIDVTSLTDGTYKLVIEPVIYLIYNHLYYAMTTTVSRTLQPYVRR